jgi:hypothetical protein
MKNFYIPLIALAVLSVFNFLILSLQKDSQDRYLYETHNSMEEIHEEANLVQSKLEKQLFSTVRLEIERKYLALNSTLNRMDKKVEKVISDQDDRLLRLESDVVHFVDSITKRISSLSKSDLPTVDLTPQVESKIKSVESELIAMEETVKKQGY